MIPAVKILVVTAKLVLLTLSPTNAASLKIVAIGASNTSGWGVGAAAAYPAQLETLLKAHGHDVQVVNAGVPFETTNGMLARIDTAVPPGTHAVIIQPGGNDLRFLGTKERRTANINAMVAKLRARGIPSIVYDPVFPPQDYQWDSIHLNAEAHAKIARNLLPQVIGTISGPAQRRTR